MKASRQNYLLFAVLSLAYLVFTLSIAPDATTLTRYNLTLQQARTLQLTVTIPYIIIWFIASWGSTRLKSYAETIKTSTDGRGVLHIANGLSVLALSLPATALLGQMIGYYQQHDISLVPAASIFSMYIDLLLGLLAMSFIFHGARMLNRLSRQPTNPRIEGLFRGGFVTLALSYSYLALTNPARQFPINASGRAAFYLPDPLIILTVIVPLLVIWYTGLSAAFYIQNYRATLHGQIYRSLLGYLSAGVFMIITSRILLRYIATNVTLFDTANLRFILVVLYALLLLISAGFVLVAIGAKKLKRIEDV